MVFNKNIIQLIILIDFEHLLQNFCNTVDQKFPGAFGTLQGYRSSQFAGECFVGLQESKPKSKNKKGFSRKFVTIDYR